MEFFLVRVSPYAEICRVNLSTVRCRMSPHLITVLVKVLDIRSLLGPRVYYFFRIYFIRTSRLLVF